MSLEALTALARRELEQLRYPVANWVLPRDGFLDVLVIGAGMCGQTATFALLREGVRNLRCLDRAPRGSEGPWTTFARMDILRSPKHLTGPDLGVAALTYRAWHEAKFGAAHWEKLHKIDRVEWANYLLWVRETAALPVQNGVEVEELELGKGCVKARLRGGEIVYSRKAVLAMGREGSGAARWPGLEKRCTSGPTSATMISATRRATLRIVLSRSSTTSKGRSRSPICVSSRCRVSSKKAICARICACLLYTSDAADE